MSFVCLTHLDKRMEGQELVWRRPQRPWTTRCAVDRSREHDRAAFGLFSPVKLLFSPLIPADDGLYSVGCTSSFCLETGGDRTSPATSPPQSSSTRPRLRARSVGERR